MLEILNIQENIILAPFTTYKIGGPADYFYIAKNHKELKNVVLYAKEKNLPYFILGSGANILFSDKGFRGLVIKNEANGISINKNRVTAESGATIEDLISATEKCNLSGFENFAGIPSTVGGALWQNLHFLTPDRKNTFFIESIFESATILDEYNQERVVYKDFFEFGYDKSILHKKSLLVLDATFILEVQDKQKITNQIKENLKWRSDRQPALGTYPSCGSVFKKIEGFGAGRLIEEAGLKGFQVGSIQSSEKHANFLVNLGGGTASDVVALIDKIKKEVKDRTGHTLETEISLVGEYP